MVCQCVLPAASAQTGEETTCLTHPATILGTSGSDNIVGSLVKMLFSLGGDDTIRAGGAEMIAGDDPTGNQ